jgi:biopolymer transport protein TolR
MAMNVGGGQRISGRLSVPTTLAEINVTPLVDVMLVLLIVFMVSAPMMQQGIQVDLPKANASTLNEVPDQLVVTISRSRQIQINGKEVPNGQYRARLEAIASVKPDVQVFIHADHSLPYGFIAQVMAETKNSRVSRVGLVTEPGETGPKL